MEGDTAKKRRKTGVGGFAISSSKWSKKEEIKKEKVEDVTKHEKGSNG